MQTKINPQQPAANQAADIHPKVLVIDDDLKITASIATLLASSGYSTICCHTCDEAFQGVRNSVPDMVIADLNLAGYSGLELCHQLRLEAGMNDVPWMFLSGAQTPDIIRRTDETGGAYYLRKPFDSAVLLELVRKAMWLPEAAICSAALT